jgi:hypothetical protein
MNRASFRTTVIVCLLGISVFGCQRSKPAAIQDSPTTLEATSTSTTLEATTTTNPVETTWNTSVDGSHVADESHGGLTLEQQREAENSMDTTDWTVTTKSTPNATGYEVAVTITQTLTDPVAAPTFTITSKNGIYPSTVPTGCTVDTENIYCDLIEAHPTLQYPASFVFQFPTGATELNVTVDPSGDTELTPADNTNTITLNQV